MENDQTPNTLLPYHIINPYKNFGEGDINSIINKEAGRWKSLIGTDKIVIRCGFKDFCKINYMEARVADAHLIEFIAYNEDKYQFEEMKLVMPKERDGSQPIKHQFKEKQTVLDQIEIHLSSFSKKQLGVHYFIFYGVKIKPKVVVRVSEPIAKQLAKPLNIERKKTNGIDQAIRKQLANEKLINDKTKKVTKKENPQLQIKKNKLHSNEPLVMKSGIEEEDLINQLEINEEQNSQQISLDEPNLRYQVVEVKKEDLVSIFGNVSDEWLAAQKQTQFDLKIKTRHRLSTHINPKCFQQQIFCVSNLYGSEKSRLVKMIKELGGLVREQPSENAIMVTPNMKGSSVGIARLMNNVKFVSPEYIDNCFGQKTKLGMKKYSLKAADALYFV